MWWLSLCVLTRIRQFLVTKPADEMCPDWFIGQTVGTVKLFFMYFVIVVLAETRDNAQHFIMQVFNHFAFPFHVALDWRLLLFIFLVVFALCGRTSVRSSRG